MTLPVCGTGDARSGFCFDFGFDSGFDSDLDSVSGSDGGDPTGRAGGAVETRPMPGDAMSPDRPAEAKGAPC